MGTSEGIDRFREWPVTPLSVKQGLSNSNATSVLAARDGSIWIGTADGLNRWKEGRTTIYRRRTDPGLPDDSIQSLFEDERGRIWVSGSRGLAAFENGKFTAVPAVPGGFTHAIASDNRGGLWLSLWLTSNDYGLAHLVDGKIIEHAPWQKLGGGPGTGLVPDPDGGVWTGLLSGGVANFRAGQIRNLSLTGDGASTIRKVLDVSRDRDGTIWVATDSGLSRITNGRVATLTTANGLPCPTVHWIIEDQLASYWLYTACGLVRIARTELDAWTADPKRMIRSTTFDSADGILLVPILRPSRPAVTKSSDGKIWFVNGATVSFIDPSHIGINTLPPPVHIEQITADGTAFESAPGLAAAAARPQSADRLHRVGSRRAGEGPVPLHAGRSRISTGGGRHASREAFYTDLAPGSTGSACQGSNNSGVWNEAGDDAGILDRAGVLPDPLVRGAGGRRCVRCPVGWLSRPRSPGRAPVRAAARRTSQRAHAHCPRAARHAAAGLPRSAAAIPDRVVPAAESPGRGERATWMRRLNRRRGRSPKGATRCRACASSTVERTNLAVWLIRTLGTSSRPTASAAADPHSVLPSRARRESSIRFVRDEIYKIAAEALRNAFRHAHAGRVEVEIRYDDEQFRLRVRDDGKGIDPKVLANQGLEGHYGLRGMPERAALMGGKLAVWSEVGAGTEVELRLPARIVYATSRRRSWWSRLLASKTPAHVEGDAS